MNLPAGSVTDILEYVNGVDVKQRGAHGVQADVGIRGSSYEQTLILIDGITMNDPQTGHHNMDLPVNLRIGVPGFFKYFFRWQTFPHLHSPCIPGPQINGFLR